MYEIAKKAREAMRGKAKRLSSEVDMKTDSSDWTPAEPLEAQAKTGMRPVSKRVYKKGGKVMGAPSVKHAGRKGRKAGGRLVDDNDKKEAKDIAIAKMNRNQKEANAEREGVKHVGALKRGGRAKKAFGGLPMPQDVTKKVLSGLMTGAGEVQRKGGGKVKRKGHADGERVDPIADIIAADRSVPADVPMVMRSRRGASQVPDVNPAQARQMQQIMNQSARDSAAANRAEEERALFNLRGYKKGGKTKARKEGGKVNYGPADNYDSKPGVSTAQQISEEKREQAASKPTRGKAQHYADGGQTPDPRLGIVKDKVFNFGMGASGSPYKKGGMAKWEGSAKDEAQDKKLAKKHGMSMKEWEASKLDEKHDKQQSMKGLKSGGSADGKNWIAGAIEHKGALHKQLGVPAGEKIPAKKLAKAAEKGGKLGKRARLAETLKGLRPGKFYGGAMGGNAPQVIPPAAQQGMQLPAMAPNMGAGKPVGYAKGGKAKGKTNINIVISAGQKQPGMDGMTPPPGGPGAPPPGGGVPIPMGMPPAGGAGAGAGAAPAAMPMPIPMPMPAAGGAPMPRKAGGRISKVASSYKDMTAGAGSGEGRLQKTDIAKRSAHKAGGGVYRSYKDMDAGAGSGLGRLEKTEIQKRK